VKGQLCYIIGTVYLDMPLKPNVLEDIGKEVSSPAALFPGCTLNSFLKHWLTPPPPPSKYHSASDTVMLEDESGRVKLSFPGEQGFQLVTGIIMAALGAENQSGDFEVVDICFSGMAPQAPLGEAPISQDTQMDVDEGRTGSFHDSFKIFVHTRFAEPVAGPSKGKSSQPGSWIALVSGLDISSHPTPTFDKQEISLQLLNEYIQAELGGIDDQEESAQLSRVVVAGGILGPIARAEDPQGESKKASSAPAVPTSHPTPLQQATAFLKELCHSIPVHILPGASDPAGTTLPQQPLLKGLFGLGKGAGDEEALISESNPTWISIDGCQ
jgi:DNA polymerase delta subunit 2